MQVIISEIACFVDNLKHLLITPNRFYVFFNNISSYRALCHFCVGLENITV